MLHPETQPGPQQLPFDDRADPTVNPLAGMPVHELEGFIHLAGETINGLPGQELPADSPLAERLRFAKDALAAARDKADGRNGGEFTGRGDVSPVDVGKYALRIDGSVEVVSEAGAAQIDAGGNPSLEHVWSSLPAANRPPTKQSTTPRSSQPWGSGNSLGGPARRRLQL